MAALAPIVVFAFNRPDLLEKSLKQLVQCELAEMSEIYFFIDGARNSSDFKPIDDCCTLAQKYSSYFSKSSVIKRDINLGLAISLKDGISKVLTKNDSVIVLEDDLVVGKSFLKFILQKYYKLLNKFRALKKRYNTCNAFFKFICLQKLFCSSFWCSFFCFFNSIICNSVSRSSNLYNNCIVWVHKSVIIIF